jgi:hypothetical protein
LFDGGWRQSGSGYHFTFPVGTFRIADPSSGDTQKVRVAPRVRFGDEEGAIVVKWARMPLGGEFVFDVKARRGDASFEMWHEGSSSHEGVTENLPGDDWFRA